MGCFVQFPLGTIINAAYPGNQLFTVSSNETVHVEIDSQVHDHEANWYIDNQLTRSVFYRVAKIQNSDLVEFAIDTLGEPQKAIAIGGKPILDILVEQVGREGHDTDRVFLYNRACEQRFFPPAAAHSEATTCDRCMVAVALVLWTVIAINFIAMKQSG